MTKTNVPELTGYQAVAAELRRIAGALDALPPAAEQPYITLQLLPGNALAHEGNAAAVDVLAHAVFGEPGKTRKDAGQWRHLVERTVGGIHVQIHARVPDPADERDVELERLRAEVAELRARVSAPVPSAASIEERDGCPVDGDGTVRHLLECAEDREAAELAAWPHGCDGDHEDRSDCADA